MYPRTQDAANQSPKNAVFVGVNQRPSELKKPLIWDRGKERMTHRQVSLATDIGVYICDPCSHRQRGSNEDTNGPLRQYFPEGTDLSEYSQA